MGWGCWGLSRPTRHALRLQSPCRPGRRASRKILVPSMQAGATEDAEAGARPYTARKPDLLLVFSCVSFRSLYDYAAGATTAAASAPGASTATRSNNGGHRAPALVAPRPVVRRADYRRDYRAASPSARVARGFAWPDAREPGRGRRCRPPTPHPRSGGRACGGSGRGLRRKDN